jgi:hypothetical protein
MVLVLLALLFPRFWPFAGINPGSPSSGRAGAPFRRVLRVDPGGGADYRTIKVERDATIDVLGAGVYHEAVVLADPAVQGLTLEAPDHATLAAAEDQNNAVVRVKDVPNLKIRGFRIESSLRQHGAVVTGLVSGLEFDDVRFIQPPESGWAGFHLTGGAAGPIAVRHCLFQCGQLGMVIEGEAGAPVSHVRVENNRFFGSGTKLFLTQAVQDVTAEGNVLVNGIGVGLNLSTGMNSRKIRVSNNTFVNSSSWLTFEGEDLPPEGVISNNLVLGAEGINRVGHDIKDLRKNWKFHNNWWEPGLNTDEGAAEQYADLHHNVQLLSRDPANADFLRPSAGSPLGSAGAGGDEPPYIGAFAPAAAK